MALQSQTNHFLSTEILCLVLCFLFQCSYTTRRNMWDEISVVCLGAFPGIIMFNQLKQREEAGLELTTTFFLCEIVSREGVGLRWRVEGALIDDSRCETTHRCLVAKHFTSYRMGNEPDPFDSWFRGGLRPECCTGRVQQELGVIKPTISRHWFSPYESNLVICGVSARTQVLLLEANKATSQHVSRKQKNTQDVKKN